MRKFKDVVNLEDYIRYLNERLENWKDRKELDFLESELSLAQKVLELERATYF